MRRPPLLLAPTDPMQLAPPAPAATTRGTSPPGRIVGAAAFGTLAALTLAHPSATRLHVWPWCAVTAGLWLLPAGLLLAIACGPTWRRPNTLASLGLVLLAGAGVASAAASPFAATSLGATLPLVGGVALVFALHHLLAAGDAATARARAGVAGRILAAAGAILAVVSLVGWWRVQADAPGFIRNEVPFGHSTYTAGVLLLVLPWLAARVVHARGLARLGWAAATLAGLAALAATSSRGAIAALAAVVLGATALTLVRSRASRRTKWLLAAAAIALVAAAIGTNPRLRELVLRRTWGDTARESNRQRAAMLDAGRQLGAQRPALGWGPGTVPLAYPQVRANLDGGVDNVLQLHSTPLQLWATLGLAGALAAALAGAGVAAAGCIAVRRGRADTPVLAAAASLGGYALFALTDHQLDLPAVTALVAANAALLTSAAGRQVLAPDRRRRLLALSGITLLAALPATAALRDLRARWAFDRALSAWDAGRSDEFIARTGRASEIAPHDAFYAHQIVGELLRLRDREPDAAKRRALTQAAIARLEASLATGAHEEFARFNLGWLHLELGEPEAAARHFRAALRLVPDKAGACFGLGLAFEAAGRRDDAVRALALEWLNDPRSVTSPAWDTPALAPLRAAVQAEALRLYAGLRAAHPAAAVAGVWIRWWLGDDAAAAGLGRGFSADAAAFAAALPQVIARAPVDHQTGWAAAYHAWRAPDTPEAFVAVTGGDRAFAAALQRRARQHASDFRTFVSAPVEDPALVLTLRRQRTGYGVLARHPDAPPLTDVYIVQENRLAATFAAGLFPPKGWLPGRHLLALLPPEPR